MSAMNGTKQPQPSFDPSNGRQSLSDGSNSGHARQTLMRRRHSGLVTPPILVAATASRIHSIATLRTGIGRDSRSITDFQSRNRDSLKPDMG